ncbi:hypothetical protein L3Q82_005789 [Scortum barcoo]|uniref:Uncharacterized protein n=1 Tax=Scortum barcoo TaxID=214431 RepID=A0ACB8V6T3_9TELE|nr:hypothetical protein L3Q82_005789 [Scortum barcoo]
MDRNQQILTGEETNYLELELGELLQEFQDVVTELKAPSQSKPHAYQHVLQEAKNRTGQGEDSGVEDSDYTKLGDTSELESYINMLDQELAGSHPGFSLSSLSLIGL